ncbi:MAG TPA: hypothetical protein PK129_02290 [Cellvibrionaceae bacterium]|nr:hypothetical protein [Cellvibrionaceae bacterium]
MTDFKLSNIGNTQILACTGGVQMIMLVRRSKEYFTDFIKRAAQEHNVKLIVNGSFTDLSYGAIAAVKFGNNPLEASESKPIGQVIQEGQVIAGSSSPGKFSFSQVSGVYAYTKTMCGIDRFSVRMGDGPIATTAAIGGVAPIIIDGLPYGETNVYSPGVPAGAPVRGEVDARYKNYLTQKSNAMYAAILARGGDVGKTALGYSSYSRTLYVLGQADGQAGLDANGIRANFIAKKIDNAVFLDCSDSATLYFDGKFLIKPGDNKNEFLTVAVGFR